MIILSPHNHQLVEMPVILQTQFILISVYSRDTVSAANPIIIVRKSGWEKKMHHEYTLDADFAVLSNRETLCWSWLTPTGLLVN